MAALPWELLLLAGDLSHNVELKSFSQIQEAIKGHGATSLILKTAYWSALSVLTVLEESKLKWKYAHYQKVPAIWISVELKSDKDLLRLERLKNLAIGFLLRSA